MDSMDFQLRLKPVMDVSDIQGNLGTLQQYLNKLKLPDNMKSGFKETFANAEKEITKIQDILGKKTKTKGDVLGLEKSFGNLDKYLNKLSTDMGKLSGKKVLQGVKFDTPEIQKTIQQISDLKQRMSALTGDEVKQVTAAIDGMRNSASKISNVRLDKILNNIKTGNITAAQKELDGLVKYKDKLQTQSVKEDYGVGIKKMQDAINSLKSKGGITQITGDIQKLDTTLDGLNANELEKSMIGVGNSAGGVRTLADNTRQLGTELRGATSKSVELNNQVNQLKDRAKYFFSLTNGVMLFRRALRQAFNSVKELDASMTEIAVVTDFDIGDMWDKLPEYTKNANELGVSIKSMYDAAGLYYQQGLKTNEVMQLTNETMKMARIAGMEASEATDRMTAALRGFNMEINETSAQRINDVYSQLAAMSASNTDEISSAMTKTASIAANAGMEFETTSAFLAQMIETTREAPENLGTAMKTIVARFTEMKNAPGDIFTDMEGEEVSVNKVDTALRSVGVSLKDANGQFRDLDDVFIELASKWDSLDKNTQRYVATTAAGSRQQSRFIAMMSNYDRTMELVNAANTSAGASQDQFSKTTESLESKLARLKNAWDQFVTGIANSTLIKTGIDLLTGFLNIINKLTTGFGILKGDVGGIISSFLKIGTAIAGLNIGKNIVNFGFDKFAARFVKAGQDAGTAYSAGFGQRASAGLHKTMNAISHPVQTAKSAGRSLTKNLTATDRKVATETAEKSFATSSKKSAGLSSSIKKYKDSGNTKAELAATKQLTAAQKEQAATLNTMAAAKGFSNATAQQANAIAAQNVAYLGAETSATTLLQAAEGGLTAAKLTELQAQMIANGMDEEQIANSTQLIIQKYAEAGATTAATAAQSAEAVTTNMGLLTKIKFYATLLFGTKTKIENMAATYGLSAAEAAEAVAAGTATTAQWLLNAALTACPIGWIAAGVVILVGALIGLSAIIETDAEKMERLNETSEGLGDQLDTANERLTNLTDQQSNLQKLNQELDGLTKGSAEWNSKLLEINQTVMDLIDKYPTLAQYMEIGEDGQMSITDEGFEVAVKEQQEAVKSLQFAKQSVDLSITKLQKDMDAREMAQNEVNTSSAQAAHTWGAIASGLTGNLGAMVAEIVNAVNADEDEDLLQQKIAEGMSAAGISAQDENLLDKQAELKRIYETAGGDMQNFDSWLKKLADASDEVKQSFDEMGQAARANTLQQDAQTKAMASTIVNQDSELSDSKYKDALIGSITSDQIDAATQDMIGKLSETWGIDDNWGYDNYDKRLESEYAKLMGITREEAKAQREANEITKEQMEAAVAANLAQEELTKATKKLENAFIELEDSMPDKADDVNRIMAGQGTEKDYNDFVTDKDGKKRDMSTIFANINSEKDSERTSAIGQAREIIRAEYGDDFANSLTPEMIQSFITSLMGLKTAIEGADIHKDMNITNTPENSGGFSVAAQNNISSTYTTENSKVLNSIFNTIAGQLTPENENEVNSLIANTDFSDSESISQLMRDLEGLGVNTKGLGKKLVDATDATHEYTTAQINAAKNASTQAEEDVLGQSLSNKIFSEEQYKNATNNGVSPNDFVTVENEDGTKSYIYIGENILTVLKQIEANTSKKEKEKADEINSVVGAIADMDTEDENGKTKREKIDEENKEAKKEIKDNRAVKLTNLATKKTQETYGYGVMGTAGETDYHHLVDSGTGKTTGYYFKQDRGDGTYDYLQYSTEAMKTVFKEMNWGEYSSEAVAKLTPDQIRSLFSATQTSETKISNEKQEQAMTSMLEALNDNNVNDNNLTMDSGYDAIKAAYDKYFTGDGKFAESATDNYTTEDYMAMDEESLSNFVASQAPEDGEEASETFTKASDALKAQAEIYGVSEKAIYDYEQAIKKGDKALIKSTANTLKNEIAHKKSQKTLKTHLKTLKDLKESYGDNATKDNEEYLADVAVNLGMDASAENLDFLRENFNLVQDAIDGDVDSILALQDLMEQQYGFNLTADGNFSGVNGELDTLSTKMQQFLYDQEALGKYELTEVTIKTAGNYIVPNESFDETQPVSESNQPYTVEYLEEGATQQILAPKGKTDIKQAGGGGSSGGGGGGSSSPQKNTKKSWHHNRDVKSEKRDNQMAKIEHQIAMEQTKQIPNLKKLNKLHQKKLKLLEKEANKQKENYNAAIKKENQLWKYGKKKGWDKFLNKDGTVNREAYNDKEWKNEKEKEAFDEWESNMEDTREYKQSSKEAQRDANLELAELKNARSEYTKLTNLSSKYEARQNRINNLQTKYNLLLKDANSTAGSLVLNTMKQIKLLKQQKKNQKNAFNTSKKEAKNYKKTSKIGKYIDSTNFKTGKVTFDWKKINKDIKDGKVSQEYIDEMLGKYEEMVGEAATANSNLLDIESQLQDIETAIKESVLDTQGQVREAIVQLRQDEIDALSEIDSSINDTNSKILSEVQNNISEMRQDRKNTDTEEDIADKETRLAYLKQYSGGGNAVEIAKLEEELSKNKEDYTNTLIDQKISELQKQNNEASEQRQRQIKIMQKQLEVDQENGEITKEVINAIATGNWKNILRRINGFDNMTPEEQEAYKEREKEMEANLWLDGIQNKGKGATKGQDFTKSGITDISSGVTLSEGSTTSNGGVVTSIKSNAYGEATVTSEKTGGNGFTASYTNTYSADAEGNFKYDPTQEPELADPMVPDEDGPRENWFVQLDKDGIGIAQEDDAFGFKGNKGLFKIKSLDYDNNELTLYKPYGTNKGAFTVGINDVQSTYSPDQTDKKFGENTDPRAKLQFKKGSTTGDMKYELTDGIKAWVWKKNDETNRWERYGISTKAGKALYKKFKGKALYLKNKNLQITGDKSGKKYYRFALPGATDKSKYIETLQEPKNIKQFKTGGLADFTGPAWLDGTKTKPEIILNQKDTENFIQLKNILADIMKGGISNTKQNSGDSYAEIHINVEKMTSDYDVDQVAKRVKKILNDDGRYRTVNQINRLR